MHNPMYHDTYRGIIYCRTAYQFVRKASQIFIKNKSFLNADHEFGIIVLEDEASWVSNIFNC